MRWSPRHRTRVPWPVLFAMLSCSCSGPASLHREEATGSDRRPVPFQQEEGERADDSAQLATAVAPASTLPFRDAEELPAGTLLTIRLQSPILAGNAMTPADFSAALDEPLPLENGTVVSPGAKVGGRVESARASLVKRDRGYVCLTLSSIEIDGRSMPLQTTSLFVRGMAHPTPIAARDDPAQLFRLEPGRRLTFRLTESLALANNPPALRH
jgi:hypothetical protein